MFVCCGGNGWCGGNNFKRQIVKGPVFDFIGGVCNSVLINIRAVFGKTCPVGICPIVASQIRTSNYTCPCYFAGVPGIIRLAVNEGVIYIVKVVVVNCVISVFGTFHAPYKPAACYIGLFYIKDKSCQAVLGYCVAIDKAVIHIIEHHSVRIFG